jgi:hypothetical protein
MALDLNILSSLKAPDCRQFYKRFQDIIACPGPNGNATHFADTRDGGIIGYDGGLPQARRTKRSLG